MPPIKKHQQDVSAGFAIDFEKIGENIATRRELLKNLEIQQENLKQLEEKAKERENLVRE